jgi:hypothetical protein
VDPAIRRDQRERPHVVAEAADDVVGLAVDVGADRAADRDLAGAGQHRQPQAVRQGGAHQRVEAHARVDIDEPALASIAWISPRPVMASTVPPAFCAGSP